VIRHFRHRGLKRLYTQGDRSGVRPDLVAKIERVLTVLNSATSVRALDVPGYRLHPLRGDLTGFMAVTITANWRIIFRFEGDDAYDVDLVDYH